MSGELDEARRRFADRYGRAPQGDEVVYIPPTAKPQAALAVGALFGLAYDAAGDGTRYFHEFRNRPTVYVSADGRQVYILGGGYRFTSRGFVG